MNFPNSKPVKILITFLISSHLFSITTPTKHNHPNAISNNHKHKINHLHTNPNFPQTAPTDSLSLNPQMDESDSERQEFLAAHNKVRLHVGEPFFSWAPKLAQYAARYAAQRASDCDLVHSGGPYGENIFWGSGNEWTPTDVVKLWVKEHRYYNRITNTCMPEKMCGHYTQIVWRSSLRLGCARVQCDNGDIFAICSYDPPGNYIGERPFANND